MNRGNEKTNQVWYGIVAFIVPVCLLLIVYAVWGQWPFGNKTLLIWDMNWQYCEFFSHLHNILHGDASALYSFSRALGGDMIGVAAYYLISPFNLLFYFFDEQNIYMGIFLVTCLKTGAIGLTMQLFLQSKRPGAATVFFSTAYALCAYVVGYSFNIMWLDGIILLPLMVWGIEKLVEEGKYLLYTLALAGAIITNFYMGYMLCIFSVLYFAVYFLLLSKGTRRWSTCLRYAAASLAGGMLSACIALPTVFAMQGGKKRTDFSTLFDFLWQLDSRWLFSSNFAGTTQARQMTNGQPLMYCGVVVFLLLLFYFIGCRDQWKRKAGYLLLLGIMILSFGFQNLCRIWQVFNLPNGSPYRYSFLFCFLGVLVAYEAYDKGISDKTWERRQYVSWLGICLVTTLGIFVTRAFFVGSGKQWTPWVNLILVVVYAILLLGKEKKAVRVVLCVVFGAELCLNAGNLYWYSDYYEPASVSDYRAYMQQMKPLVELAESEDDIYRTVLTGDGYWSVNDPFFFNLYGLDSYTSVERDTTHQMAYDLGYYTNMTFGIHYKTGSTHTAESLLGVKYLITSEHPGEGYHQIAENGNLALYENETVFPFAWFADESIAQVKNEPYDSLDYQNRILQCIGEEKKEQVLEKLDWELAEVADCEETADGGHQLKEGVDFGYVTYRLHPEKTGMVYLQTINLTNTMVQFIVNDELVDYSEQESIVKRLGSVTPEDEIYVRYVLMPDSGIFSSEQVAVYLENEAALEAYAGLWKDQVTVFRKSDSNIHITCENTKDETRYLVCTFPYDEGWHITVDGEEAKPTQVMGNFTALAIEPGVHEIALRFIPKGMLPGIGVTVVTMIGLIILGLYRRKAGEGKEIHEN